MEIHKDVSIGSETIRGFRSFKIGIPGSRITFIFTELTTSFVPEAGRVLGGGIGITSLPEMDGLGGTSSLEVVGRMFRDAPIQRIIPFEMVLFYTTIEIVSSTLDKIRSIRFPEVSVP